MGWHSFKHALAVIAGANLLAMSALAGASGGDPVARQGLLAADEILWLKQHPDIRIAPTPDYSPIEFFDGKGNYSGITADYFELIQQRLGYRFKVVRPTPEQWLQLEPDSRGADVITASAETARRRQFWDFSTTYLTLPTYVITRVSAEDGLSLEKLAGFRVAVVSGWAAEEFIRSNHPNVIVESMPDPALALQKVSFGLVDAFVSELPVVEAWMEKEGVSNLKISAEAGYTYQLGIAVRKDWPELLSILEKALATITPEERNQIVDRWIQPHTPLERRRERMGRYLAWGASGLAVLLVTVMVWNRLLAARVRAGTRELRDELARRSQAEAALHASEERFAKAFRTSFETANEATFLMRQDRVADCNAKMLTLLGGTREQLLNSQLQDLSPPTQPDGANSEEKSKAHIERAFAGEPQLFEWVHRRCDGQFFEAEVSLNRLELVGETLLQGVIHDVSVRKRAEAALRQSEERFREMNATLERRVAERTEELAVAKERAESADRLKSAFLATMSHELRTPLNSIIGFTGIMLQGLAGPLNPEQTKQLGMVQGSARHLLALINDVLDISKIEAGQLDIHPEPFELGASLERVTSTVRPLADKKGLLLRVVSPTTPVGMVSDRVRVEQVLLNLLNNAVKFTPQGEVALQAELLHDYVLPGGQAPQPAVRLQVTDTGIGIKEEDLVKLFQPFRQVDTGLARQHEGTGLGLAICRRLAGMLGGTIDVRSIWGIGTIFTFIIPLHRVNNHEARNPAH